MTQPASLREQLKALERLQEIDLKIDSLKKNKTALPAGLKALDDSLARTKAQVTLKKNAIAEIEKLHRQTKAAQDLNSDRLTRSSGKLEAVSNSHEFQAASKELEQLRKLALTLEDQIKKYNVEIENGNKDLTTFTVELDKKQTERDEQGAKVSGQDSQINSQIDELSAERKQFTSIVERATLAIYDRVRGARGGLGIVPAVGGRCKGCNMMVPPQLFNEVQKTLTLHACPSCHRILYVPQPEAPQAEAIG